MATPFTIYNPANGAILRSGSVADQDIQAQAAEGEAILSGAMGDWATQRVEIVDGTPTLAAIVIEDPTLAELKAATKARMADRRWQIEVGGVLFGGTMVATDDRSKTLLDGAHTKAVANPAFTTRWKTAAGWVPLDAPTIIALYEAVLAHVQACFAREEELEIEIDAAADEAALSVIAGTIEAFWP